VSEVLDTIRLVVTIAIGVTVLVAAVVALIDAARRPESAYAYAGKQNKRLWLLILGGGLLFAVLGALGLVTLILNIIALAPAGVYWYDVRPAVKNYGGSRPGGW